MQLSEAGLKNREEWTSKGYRLPEFDRETVMAATKENPFWIHFGAGNIFRAFQANVAQELLNRGILDTGLIAAEGYDYEIIEKMYRPHDNLSILATLKADGTVIASFYPGVPQGDLSSWENIVAVVPGAGLRADGTVVTYIPESDVSQWRNIVQIASNEDCLCGLRDDGSVLVTGKMLPQACLTNPAKAVSSWREIIAVSMSSYHIMGLRTDGTVVTCGNNAEGRCDVSGWSDIVAIEAGDTHSVGIKADGTIVTTAPKIVPNKLQEAQTWKLFESLDTVDQEMAEAQAQHKIALEKEQTALQAELANLKGLFSGGKRRQVEARLAEIEAELARL